MLQWGQQPNNSILELETIMNFESPIFLIFVLAFIFCALAEQNRWWELLRTERSVREEAGTLAGDWIVRKVTHNALNFGQTVLSLERGYGNVKRIRLEFSGGHPDSRNGRLSRLLLLSLKSSKTNVRLKFSEIPYPGTMHRRLSAYLRIEILEPQPLPA